MTEKTLDELLELALDEMQKLQAMDEKQWGEWHKGLGGLPPTIPFGDGRHVMTTNDGLSALHEFGRRWRAESDDFKAAIRKAEAEQLAVKTFGRIMGNIDKTEYPHDTSVKTVLKDLMEKALEQIASPMIHHVPVRVIDVELQTFEVGPVRFLQRLVWLDFVVKTAGRTLGWVEVLRNHWSGGSDAPTVPGEGASGDDWTAYSIVNSFGQARWVAVVDVSGRERLRARECAEIAVRVAIDTLGLVLDSEQARGLRGPGDRKDITLDRHYTQRSNFDISYSSRIDLPHFSANPGGYSDFLDHTVDVRAFAGAALESFIDPKSKSPKAKLHRRWVEAMYWYGQALREPMEFIGLVNAGVALDVLAKGSKYKGISAMCSALFGIKPDTVVTGDGRTLDKVVKEIYDDGRSKFSHGGKPALLQDLPIPRDAALSLVSPALTVYAGKLDLYIGPDEYEDFLKAMPTLNLPEADSPGQSCISSASTACRSPLCSMSS